MDFELIKQIENNRIDLFKLWQKTGEVKKLSIPEVDGFISNYPSAKLNRIFRISTSAEKLPEKIEIVKKCFEDNSCSFIIHTGPTTCPEGIEKLLEKHNFTLISRETGMALSLKEFNESLVLAENMNITRVTNNEMLKHWCNIFGKSFGATEAEINSHYELELKLSLSEEIPRIHYLCYINNMPVSCSTLYKGKNEAGIYCIGTLREFRGNGIGKLMTVKPLLDAKDYGYELAVLHASEYGFSIYKKLGFKKHCCLHRYLYK